jgi:hypothetical protein
MKTKTEKDFDCVQSVRKERDRIGKESTFLEGVGTRIGVMISLGIF